METRTKSSPINCPFPYLLKIHVIPFQPTLDRGSLARDHVACDGVTLRHSRRGLPDVVLGHMADERGNDAAKGLVSQQTHVDWVASRCPCGDLEAVEDVWRFQVETSVVLLVPFGHDAQVTHDAHDELRSLHLGEWATLSQGSLDFGTAVPKVELLAHKGLGTLVAFGFPFHATQAHFPAGTLNTLDTGAFSQH